MDDVVLTQTDEYWTLEFHLNKSVVPREHHMNLLFLFCVKFIIIIASVRFDARNSAIIGNGVVFSAFISNHKN